MNQPQEPRTRQPEYASLSVALMSAGVVLVAVGLATAHLAVTVIGVLVIVAGWLAASGVALPPRRPRR